MKREKMYKKVNIKAEAETYNDICSTCNHVHGCVNLKRGDRPVWFCEEFDNYVPVEEKTNDETIFQPVQSYIEQDSMEDVGRQFQGLCINCEDRHTCNLMKPNGGVWHCQEYR